MPNSIIPQGQDGQNLYNVISLFLRDFRVGKQLGKCNAHKEKGISVMDVFRYKLCNVF